MQKMMRLIVSLSLKAGIALVIVGFAALLQSLSG
jgi:hypothetical protein